MPRFVFVRDCCDWSYGGAALAQGKMDCNAMYKGFWDKFNETKHASVSAEDTWSMYSASRCASTMRAKRATNSTPDSFSTT